ncbi:dihydrolipoamide acetyltransferase family protein [Microbacterium sp. RD1]|uniref:dihydrolipoamide acetyltransferase family protein n=1 Tax=Microbacterium sp. RD1 TaxID=3457313 RepID=UPI003FA5938E
MTAASANTVTAQIFRLPDLGEGLTEAELVQWLVEVGDTIAIDQPIAEVETAKSSVELPSPFAGVVLALHGTVGETLLVGAPVIEVGAEGAAAAAAAAPVEASPGEATSSGAKGLPAEAAEIEAYREEERAGSGNVLIGYGTSGGHGAARRRARRAAASGSTHPVAPAPAAGPVTTGTRPNVPVRSPLLRRLARDLGVDVTSLTPSGSDGAVTRGDILRAAAVADGDAAPPAASAAATVSGASVPADLAEIGRERMSMLRRAVSTKMSRSRSEIPEATVWVDVDATRLWDLRAEMAREGERAPSLTALLARFVLLALEEYPLLASRLSDDGQEIIRYDGVNLGVAADTERGLLVPVVPRADRLSIDRLDGALREVAVAARAGQLPPERLAGSTFTLNNYGSLGVDGSAAIINHPEVAILGVGRMIERPWVVDGGIVARRIVQLSLVFDHRICDGGYAAGFLRRITSAIEHPLSLYPRL